MHAHVLVYELAYFATVVSYGRKLFILLLKDRGICCAFNMDDADKIFIESRADLIHLFMAVIYEFL